MYTVKFHHFHDVAVLERTVNDHVKIYIEYIQDIQYMKNIQGFYLKKIIWENF